MKRTSSRDEQEKIAQVAKNPSVQKMDSEVLPAGREYLCSSCDCEESPQVEKIHHRPRMKNLRECPCKSTFD